ncbi:MAG: hypothetical protein MR907_06100 [Firmicutes bacterium]|nr:hypothetical protein [Bacillota bacterium]
MKKIIATVLAMVMALALCTTAFAADTVEGYTRGTGKDDVAVSADKVTFTFTPAKDPTVTDGKTTAPGNVAYYTSGADNKTYVAVGSLAEADLVVYDKKGDDNKGKDVMLYLDEIIPEYYVATVYNSFADTCGQFKKPANFDSTKTYYVAEINGTDVLFVSATVAHSTLMVNGKTVGVDSYGNTQERVKHVAVPTVSNGKVTGYTCSKCKAVAVEAPNYASIPSDGQIINNGNWYFPAVASSTTDGSKTDSPKTFDAGIAMYVGMALTSVAGSAVVIGKKNEF